MDPEEYYIFTNDGLTDLDKTEWNTEWNNNEPNEPDCGDENDIDERPLPDSDEDIIALMDENDVMEKIIERLTKERDEARREVCDWMNTDESGCVKKSGSEETAISRGWDCYKKEETQ